MIECFSPSSSVKSGAAGWSREMQSEGNKESPTLVTITDFTDPDCSEKVVEFSSKHDSLGSSYHLPPLLGGGRLPSRFLWQQGSLATPGIVSGGENSRQDDKSGSKVYEILDDDAPGVLKDVHSPTKPVIISSPSQKRVSSPHKQVKERRLTSSTALRSGGKFILKAVPSFPPSIPCTMPRDNKSEPDGQ